MNPTEDQGDSVCYKIWVDAEGLDRRHVITAVAVLLGLDPRAATKLLDSGAPLRRRLHHAELRYLRVRFLDWGVRVRSEPEFDHGPGEDPPVTPSLPFLTERRLYRARQRGTRTLSQAQAGLAVGACAWIMAQTTLLPLFDRAGGVVLATASCATGVFWGFWRPVLSLRSIAGLVTVYATLLAALVEGTPRIMARFDTGRSSDYTGDVAVLLFASVCTALGAPLSAAVVAYDRHARARRRRGVPSTEEA